MPNYSLFIFSALFALTLARAEEAPPSSSSENPSEPLPPMNLVESPDYLKDTGEPKVQVEKLQYEALEDGRPLLESRILPSDSSTGALYEAGDDLVVSPESSIDTTHDEIEDVEDEAILPKVDSSALPETEKE